MDNLLLSLVIGVGLAFVSFTLIYKLTRLQGKQVALLIATAVLGIYLPLALVHWPGTDVFAIHLALYLITPYALGIITSHWEMHERAGRRRERWFHWAPATMVVFFLVIATVDAIIITLAGKGLTSDMAGLLLPEPQGGGTVSSFFPGTVSHDFQEKEALYNAYLEQLERQRERGWQVRKGWEGTPVVGVESRFRVEVADRAGNPVTGASVEGDFLRPSDIRLDRTVEFTEVEPGIYEYALALPQPGIWNVVLRIRRGEDLHELRGMTSLQPATTVSTTEGTEHTEGGSD